MDRQRQFMVACERQDGIGVVSVKGVMDASAADEFQRILDPLCSADRPRIIVDFAAVTYLSSTSFGLLFRYHRLCESRQGDLAVCAVPPHILNVMRVLGLDTVLHLIESRDEALTLWHSGSDPSGQDP